MAFRVSLEARLEVTPPSSQLRDFFLGFLAILFKFSTHHITASLLTEESSPQLMHLFSLAKYVRKSDNGQDLQ